jgi:hypothetical protein
MSGKGYRRAFFASPAFFCSAMSHGATLPRPGCMNPQPQTLKRLIAALLALTMGGNGVAMLAAGHWWYGAVAGVPETGPFNPHFVKDIGAAYVVVGAAFAWLAARPSPLAKGASLAAALFLVLHASIHLVAAFGDPAGLADLIRDFPGVILPALLAVWVAAAYPAKETDHAQSLA